MKTYGFFGMTLLGLVSLNAIAEDYSKCNNGVLFGRLNDKGEVQPLPGEKLISSNKKDGKDVLTFEEFDGTRHSIIIERDKQGRVISASNEKDLSSLTQKEREAIRYREAYKIAFGSLPGMCQWSRTKTDTYDEVRLNSRECPKVLVYDKSQDGYVPANYKMINKSNFKQFKFKDINSWEEFEKIRAEDKKRWSADARVVRAYSSALDQQGWSYPTGTKMSLNYQDGNCYIKKISSTITNGKNGAKSEETVYDNDRCDSMRKVFQNYSKDLNKCEQITFNALQELKVAQGIEKPSISEKFEMNLITREEALCNTYSSIVEYNKSGGSSGSGSTDTKSE